MHTVQSPGRGHAEWQRSVVPVGVMEGLCYRLFFAGCCSLLCRCCWALWGAGRFLSSSHRHAMPSRRDEEERKGRALGEAAAWTGYLLWFNMCCCGQGGLAIPQNPSPVSETFPEAAGHRSQLMGCRSQETACHNKLIFLCSDDPSARVRVICINSGKCTVVVSKRKDIVGGV